MEQAGPLALQADQHCGPGHSLTLRPGREWIMPLTKGQPSGIEEHRYLEGGTMWKEGSYWTA